MLHFQLWLVWICDLLHRFLSIVRIGYQGGWLRISLDLVVPVWRLFLPLVLVLFRSVVRLLLLQLFGLVNLLAVQFDYLYLVGEWSCSSYWQNTMKINKASMNSQVCPTSANSHEIERLICQLFQCVTAQYKQFWCNLLSQLQKDEVLHAQLRSS